MCGSPSFTLCIQSTQPQSPQNPQQGVCRSLVCRWRALWMRIYPNGIVLLHLETWQVTFP